MNKSAIFGLFLMTSLLAGTALNMNMFSPAMAAMGNGMGQYYNNNNYQSDYEKQPYTSSSYDTSYIDDKRYDYMSYDKSYDNSYDKHPSYSNNYAKSSYFMDSNDGKYNDHKNKVKEYECRTGHFEGFFVSSVEFCFDKKFDDRKHHR